jgi:hypothetical protein
MNTPIPTKTMNNPKKEPFTSKKTMNNYYQKTLKSVKTNLNKQNIKRASDKLTQKRRQSFSFLDFTPVKKCEWKEQRLM